MLSSYVANVPDQISFEESSMKNIMYLFLIVAAVSGLNGCGPTRSDGVVALAPDQVSKLADFSPNQFDHKVYVRGMAKVARNTLYWQDPDARLGDFQFVNTQGPSAQYLPVNPNFIHEPYVRAFADFFENNLDLQQKSSGNTLLVKTAVVECNPGSRAARYWVGLGAGKAAVTVVVEVYEPGRDTPSLKIYARDTASAGAFGGDSMSMMNHIMQVIAVRVTTVLEERIDVETTGH
jgi:hypothetical protein